MIWAIGFFLWWASGLALILRSVCRDEGRVVVKDVLGYGVMAILFGGPACLVVMGLETLSKKGLFDKVVFTCKKKDAA